MEKCVEIVKTLYVNFSLLPLECQLVSWLLRLHHRARGIKSVHSVNWIFISTNGIVPERLKNSKFYLFIIFSLFNWKIAITSTQRFESKSIETCEDCLKRSWNDHLNLLKAIFTQFELNPFSLESAMRPFFQKLTKSKNGNYFIRGDVTGYPDTSTDSSRHNKQSGITILWKSWDRKFRKSLAVYRYLIRII